MPQRSAQPRYRRRVVLEMTPDESALLDRLADRHATIRGAVLAGLRTLEADRTAELEAQVRELAEKLSAAQQRGETDRDRATVDLSARNGQLMEVNEALKAARTTARDLRADLREARVKLSRERDARRAADESRQAAEEALFVHHAYCAACDKLVPEAEWAEQPWRGGFATYHRRHGFHEKTGLLGQPASLLFWREHSPTGEEA